MKFKLFVHASALVFSAAAFCLPAAGQTNENAARDAGSPPRYINVVHELLKPGRAAAYSGMLSSIRREYDQFGIPAYWLELKSITGPDDAMSLNFFDSFEEAGKMAGSIGSAVGAHPELAALQDRLLEENVASVTNLFAERADGLSSRAASINFAKMRLLQVTVFRVYPGNEGEFAEAARSIAAAYEKVEGTPPWVVYAVNSGAPAPCYLMLTALSSLKDEDAAAARRAPAMEALGTTAQLKLQELARSVYQSVETNIYFVDPQASHMPQDFTAEDPIYWLAKPDRTSQAP